MEKAFGNAEELEIVSLEKKYNLQLPEDYKQFLQSCNGGLSLGEVELFLEKANETTGIRCLYGIHTNTDNEIEDDMDEYGDELPPNTLLIGDTLDGSFLFLITCGENAGVWCWDHARIFPASSEEGNAYFITSTFSEFAKKYLNWEL